MSAVSDSSQEASNAGISCNITSGSSQIFIKSEVPELQAPHTSLFTNTALLKSSPSVAEQAQKRRSSSRSIKRKKFDDELVESSLIKTSRAKPQNVTFPLLSSAIGPPSVTSTPTLIPSTSQGQADLIQTPIIDKKKQQRSQKRIKKPKSNQVHIAKDVSRWKPSDDVILILCVQQTNNLENVYRGIKFSSKFTLREVEERWYSLLYDPAISKAAVYAMKQLNPEVIAQIQAKVLFSAEEEKLIASIPSTHGSLEVFEKLLDANSSVFLPARTAKVLHAHWTLMKQYNLLQDQTSQQVPQMENLLSLSDAEDLLDDSTLTEPRDPAIDEEVQLASRKALYEIKQLENELPRYQALVETITGVSLPDFDSKTLAVLRGRIVRYLIQSKEVSLGRSAKDTTVDIDLSLEGPAWKISRKQGSIKIDSNGDFYIINEGKKPIFVDGKPVLLGNMSKISTNSVIEITVLRFIFIINQEAVSALKTKTST